MLINLRNALMAGRRLPYDAEVEYLESTGTQWIDTERPIPVDFWFDATMDITGTNSTYKTLLGARVGSGTNDYQYSFEGNANNFLARYGTNSSQYFSSIPTGMTRIRVESGGKLYINESFVKQLGVSSPSDRNMYIFALNSNGAVSTRAQYIRLYSLKYGGLNEDHDLIPVRKGTTGYLYDRVSGKLFGSAGTGDFVLGPDVVPVEYIESHGTEWIDTGVAFADNFRWAVDFNGLDVQKTIFGGRASTTRTSLLYRYSSSEVVINVAQYSSTTTPFKLGNIASGRHCVECAINQNVGNVWLDGVQVYTNEAISGTYISGVSQALFADNFGSYVLEQASSKLYKCQMWQSGTLVRSFLPVRVGTEGAAMDVLTRRIYRNAGTGAFTYGNDLKYPIPAA